MDIVQSKHLQSPNAKKLDLFQFQEIVATSLVGFDSNVVDNP